MRVPLAEYPGMNPFVLDWLNGDERFLKRQTATQATARPTTVKGVLRDALKDSNKRWGHFVGDQLDRWAAGETLTIIAGQQVGFAGGPLYTLAKLATLVRFKRDMQRADVPVTAFFWLATEDHDFDEVATLSVPVPDRQVDLLTIRAIRTADARAVVGDQPIPEELIRELLALFGIRRPQWLREGISFRDSFAELIAETFGSEIILVDALLPELRRAGAPLFEQIHAKSGEIQTTLQHRARALDSAGYREQVIARDENEYTLLFELDDQGHRRRASAATPPERTSTSALTRPLLQDFVLQPDIFVGGPAEVAYYAQIDPLYDLLAIPRPRVALRGHVLVAPLRAVKTMERYGIQPREVFRGADAIVAEREPQGVGRIQELAEEGRRDLMKRIGQIAELALPADHSLAGSFERSVGHLEYHFDKLAERAIKALSRKDRQRFAAVRHLVSTLYPDGHVQDRVVSWFAFWTQYREVLVERVVEEVEPDSAFFKVVAL